MHAKLRFFCFRPEISFLKKFDPKITTVSLSWNLVSRLIRIFRNSKFNGDVYFFHYPPEKPFLSKFASNIQNCQFKLKPGTQTNLSNQDSMVIHKFCFRPEIPFLGKIDSKFQNCQFKLKFGIKTNSNMQNSMEILTFSVWDRKHSFLANLVLRLIRICKIQWWCSHLLF